MSKAKIGKKFTRARAEEFRGQLLGWYDRSGRTLPWRYKGTQKPDPYRVWLSEIMLQQTTVAAVGPYYKKFTEKWPDIASLARAPNEEIMKEWAGLGYYSRARNLHKCAQIVANELGGRFPDNQADLKKLPGIGDYTSAAITAVAFNKPATVVDANVERVMARYFAWPVPMPAAKKDLKALAGDLFDGYEQRPGDLAQALMDLGATICTPKSPRCGSCPVSNHCAALKQNIAAQLPLQEKKKVKPQKFGHVYWITNSKGEVLVHRRPAKGMLGGMAGLPTSEWLEKGEPGIPDFLKGLKARPLKESVRHGFTHFDLELALKTCDFGKRRAGAGYYWLEVGSLENAGFPTLFRKALRLFNQKSSLG